MSTAHDRLRARLSRLRVSPRSSPSTSTTVSKSQSAFQKPSMFERIDIWPSICTGSVALPIKEQRVVRVCKGQSAGGHRANTASYASHASHGDSSRANSASSHARDTKTFPLSPEEPQQQQQQQHQGQRDSQPRCMLLKRLPHEVRLMIYEHVFSVRHPHFDSGRNSRNKVVRFDPCELIESKVLAWELQPVRPSMGTMRKDHQQNGAATIIDQAASDESDGDESGEEDKEPGSAWAMLISSQIDKQWDRWIHPFNIPYQERHSIHQTILERRCAKLKWEGWEKLCGGGGLGILASCRAIYFEALPVLYTHTTFLLRGDAARFLPWVLSPFALSQIRSLIVDKCFLRHPLHYMSRFSVQHNLAASDKVAIPPIRRWCSLSLGSSHCLPSCVDCVLPIRSCMDMDINGPPRQASGRILTHGPFAQGVYRNDSSWSTRQARHGTTGTTGTAEDLGWEGHPRPVSQPPPTSIKKPSRFKYRLWRRRPKSDTPSCLVGECHTRHSIATWGVMERARWLAGWDVILNQMPQLQRIHFQGYPSRWLLDISNVRPNMFSWAECEMLEPLQRLIRQRAVLEQDSSDQNRQRADDHRENRALREVTVLLSWVDASTSQPPSQADVMPQTPLRTFLLQKKEEGGGGGGDKNIDEDGDPGEPEAQHGANTRPAAGNYAEDFVLRVVR